MQRQTTSTASAGEALAHERELIQAFVLNERKERLLGLLERPTRRKLLDQLHHFKYLDNRFAKRLPAGVHTAVEISTLLHDRGAPAKCLVVTSLRELDRCILPLEEALKEIVGSGTGSLISCIPGQLAYFEGEEPSERYILVRSSTKRP